MILQTFEQTEQALPDCDARQLCQTVQPEYEAAGHAQFSPPKKENQDLRRILSAELIDMQPAPISRMMDLLLVPKGTY